MLDYIQLLGGFIVLIIGGEALVKGAVSIALKLKISPLVVGMTIVSFGTSAPELLVCIEAATTGHPDVSIGAVVGSNISNLGLVLGLTVLIFPLSINKDTLRIDWPLMMGATLLFFFLAKNGEISMMEGLFFFLILLSFTGWLMVKSRKKSLAEIKSKIDCEDQIETNDQNIYKDLILLVIGFIGLFYGADWLIDAVVNIAAENGISERVISLTVVAFGTSLPELVTSCTAAFRKETDISIGNLIGSNVFNILAILGLTAMVEPIQVANEINQFDVYFLLGISALIFPLMYFGRKVGRIKGVFLLIFYFSYIFLTIT